MHKMDINEKEKLNEGKNNYTYRSFILNKNLIKPRDQIIEKDEIYKNDKKDKLENNNQKEIIDIKEKKKKTSIRL